VTKDSVLLAHQENKEKKAHKEKMVKMDSLDPLDHQDHQEKPEHPDLWDQKVTVETKVQSDLSERLENPDNPE